MGICRSYLAQLELARENEDNYRPNFGEAVATLREAEAAQYAWIENRETTFSDLQSAKSTVENQRAIYEDLHRQVGLKFWDVDKCREGYQPSFLNGNDGQPKTPICCLLTGYGLMNCSTNGRVEPGDWNRECKGVCEEIKNREVNIENANAQKAELETIASNTETAYGSKQKEIDDLIEKDENQTPPWAVGPQPRPNGSKNSEELMKELKENIDLNEYLEDKDPWPPGRA